MCISTLLCLFRAIWKCTKINYLKENTLWLHYRGVIFNVKCLFKYSQINFYYIQCSNRHVQILCKCIHCCLNTHLQRWPVQKLNCDHLKPNKNFPHALLSQCNWFKHETNGFRARLERRFHFAPFIDKISVIWRSYCDCSTFWVVKLF